MVLAVVGAAYLLYKTLRQYSFAEIADALRAIPALHLVAGLGFAGCSYFCLACFDWLAVRYAGKSLPFRQTALASFTGLSIGHNVGVAALSSGAVRYRFYSRWGLSGGDIAKIIVFCGVTVALGLATLGAASLFLRPDDIAKMTSFSRSGIVLLALACLTFPAGYLLLAAVLRTPLRFRGWSFSMPRLKLALAQVAIGTINFAFVAASLHQMLSAFTATNYLKVVAASITANILAIISHVPGGLGVLEATIAHILPGPQSIAAVIAFRVIYYFIPLSIGLPLLIGTELRYRDEGEPQLKENPY
jgi:uncharacterized membrane protein YbhN (UPF0104 family)